MGQLVVLREIKTEVSLENDDPAYQNFLLQLDEERIERFSQQVKLSKFCMDAELVSVVEIGQGNTKIGPVLGVATSYLYGKHGIEIRIWTLSRDNTQSWVTICHGRNKFAINSTTMNRKFQKLSSKNMR